MYCISLRRHDSSEAESEKGREVRRGGTARESPASAATAERGRSGGRRRERHDSD